MGDKDVSSVPLNRFSEFGRLTDAEMAAIEGLGGPQTMLPRHASIRREGDPVTGFFLLSKGWAISSTLLPDGGRQILKFHLAGDVLGTPSMCCDRAVETLTAITPIVVSEVPLPRFGALLEEHPRVAAMFLLSVQRERVSLMDQLASIGRTAADARIAALLLDLNDRLRAIGLGSDQGFELPLTQEHIGDALGLTAVHVNRMLRHLETQGLIAREGHRLTIVDRTQIARLAGRPARPLRSDLSWLPQSRPAG